MSSHHIILKENVAASVSNLFRDTSVSPETTKESLEELSELINDYLNALKNLSLEKNNYV